MRWTPPVFAIAALAACGGSQPTSTATPPPAARAAAPASPTMRRSVLSFGQRVGTSEIATGADETITNTFDVHDNGRGPHADATIRLARDGTIASLEVHGHTTFGAPVEERFTLKDGHAKWDSTDEHGAIDVKEPTFFVPNSAADTDAFLLDALAKNGGTLKLLPGGTAHLETVGEMDVPVGGQQTHLVLRAITGMGLQPKYMWTRTDGTFFAEVGIGEWFGEEGAEGVSDTLAARQEELRRARDKTIAERLMKKPPAAGFALTHARVLDVEKGAWRADQTVVIVGDTIKSVSTGKPPAGAEVIDLGGKALIPGLWDMHAHFGHSDGALNIASGVTSARDVGNVDELLSGFKKQFDESVAIGPHLYRAGFIEGRGKDAAHAEVTATTEDEAKQAVEFFAKRGYQMIKIYNSMDPKLVPFLAREAHAHGMGVTGHIPCFMLANEAVRAGYDGIEHINQVLLNFFADHTTDTRTLNRFTLVGDKMADWDPHSAAARDFYKLLREHKTVLDPTYVAFEELYVFEQGKVEPELQGYVSRLPPQAQRYYVAGGLSFEGGKKELYARSWAKMLAMVRIFHDEHIDVVAGTDALAGFSLHRELELFVHGGLTPAEALRAATIVSARVMKADDKTGSIAPGKIADLVVIDGDPLRSISDIYKTVMTFRSGVAYQTKDVYQTVGVENW